MDDGSSFEMRAAAAPRGLIDNRGWEDLLLVVAFFVA